MREINLRQRGLNAIVLNTGSAKQSIVNQLQPSFTPRTSQNVEKIESPEFNYPIYKSKDYTLGHHSLERFNKMLRQRQYLRQHIQHTLEFKGKYNKISNVELKK